VRGNTLAPGGVDVGGTVDDGRVVATWVVGGRVVGGRVVGGRVVDGRVVDGRVTDGRVVTGLVVGGLVVGEAVVGGTVVGRTVVDGLVVDGRVLVGLATDVELVATVVAGLLDGGRSRGSRELGSLGTVVGRSPLAGPLIPTDDASAVAAWTSTVGRNATTVAPRRTSRPNPPTTSGYRHCAPRPLRCTCMGRGTSAAPRQETA